MCRAGFPSIWLLLLSLSFTGSVNLSLSAAETSDNLKQILEVDHRAAGNVAARDAYADLTQRDRAVLPDILTAFNGANPLAVNYLRSAFEVIVAEGAGELPMEQLSAFLADEENHQRARAMVFELISEQAPEKADKMLDGMLTDPSAEIRYQAVQKVLDAAETLEGDSQVAAYQLALQGASHQDQVTTIRDALKKAGVEVNLQRHFGLLPRWKIVGPFDNKDMKAFDIVYPPEETLDFSASYETTHEGVEGQVRWQTIKTDDDMGSVDIAKSIAPHKGAVMYLYSEYNSARDREVYFRMATANAWKLWVNGELVFAREEYHRGMRWDQYRVPVSLQKGSNRIFFKILQNEQTQDWAQRYELQMRVCDKSGKGLQPIEPYNPAK